MADTIVVVTEVPVTVEVVTEVPVTVEVAGPQGPQGVGVIAGGTTGQVLKKKTGTDYDTEWGAAASGSGTVTSVALAGTGLSISGSPVTTSGTITANVAFGTTAGTSTEGNDARIANIRASSVNNLNGQSSQEWPGGLGGIIAMDGGASDSVDAGSNAGSIITHAVRYRAGGTIRTNAGDFEMSAGGAGGSIDLSGGTGSSVTPSDESDEDGLGGSGGSINLSGGYGGEFSNGGHAGSIDMGGENAGPNIGNPGGRNSGSISTRGTGSIGLGYAGIRTTLTGTATEDRAISLPNATGTVALTQQATDYEVTDSSAGIIMKSPNNSRWRITIDNNGVLLRTALTLLFSLSFICGSQAQVRDLVYGTNNVVIGPTNTNALTFTNRVTLPIASGAATTNSLLVADGAGSSAFVSTLPKLTLGAGSATNPSFALTGSAVGIYQRGVGELTFTDGTEPQMRYFGNNLMFNSDFVLAWGNSTTQPVTGDTYILRDTANTLASRNGTNAQTYNVYGSYTNSTNYRRLSVGMSNSGIAYIRPEQAGPLTNASNFIYISGLPATNTDLPSGVLWNSNGSVVVSP
jgi:hypothetical protein